MGLWPQIWGPSGWHFIHSVAIAFPDKPTEEQKKSYQEFFTNLGEVLPCELCNENYNQKIKDNPPPLDTPEKMFEWTVDLHNQVNKQNGKPELTYEQARKEYQKRTDMIVSKPPAIDVKKMIAPAIGGIGIGVLAVGAIKKSKWIMAVGGVITVAGIIFCAQPYFQGKERSGHTN